MSVVIFNSVFTIGILGFFVAAVSMAFKGKWWGSFLRFVGAMMTFLLAGAWSAFATDEMDTALGAMGLFALLAVGMVLFFVAQARAQKEVTDSSEA